MGESSRSQFYYPSIFVWEQKNKETLSQDSRHPNQDSNLSLSEYKTEALLLEPVRPL
jgi:hypothetical protein